MNENTRYYHAVTVLKQAIEQSRYRVVNAGNAELIALPLLWNRTLCIKKYERRSMGNRRYRSNFKTVAARASRTAGIF